MRGKLMFVLSSLNQRYSIDFDHTDKFGALDDSIFWVSFRILLSISISLMTVSEQLEMVCVNWHRQ